MTASPATFIGLLIRFYQTTIFVYALLSWFARDGSGALGGLYRTLAVVCEPFVGLFRRILPSTGGVDFSPFVAMIVLALAERLVYMLG